MFFHKVFLAIQHQGPRHGNSHEAEPAVPIDRAGPIDHTVPAMKLNIDHHVHTRYSNCCNEDYGLKEIIEAQNANGMSYVCVSDHIHTARDTGGLEDHHRALATLPSSYKELPVYLGVEMTFTSPEGDIPVDPGALPAPPSFTIGGCHHFPWDKDLTMGDVPGGRAKLARMTEQGLTELLLQHHRLLQGAVQKARIDILAHPFDFFFRLGIFDARLLDMFHDTVRLCKKHRVAIEVNNASARRCDAEEKKNTPFNSQCIAPKKFFSALITMAMEEKVPLSPASDAHARNDIGCFDSLLPYLEEAGAGPGDFLRLDSLDTFSKSV
ncbi:MAG: PHP domain-containing protein [Spirochaetales bacterium]|nr:PHP domain-containing protein [Spirochaetales bacterium]